MIAGLPGTGIGGLFYALAAVLMPVRELVSKSRGERSPRRWKLIVRQIVLASLVVAAMWVTGDVVGWLLEVYSTWCRKTGRVAVFNFHTLIHGQYNILNVTFIYWTFAAIVLVHLGIHGACLTKKFLRFRRSRHALQAK